MATYRIVRFHKNEGREVIQVGLDEESARDHCRSQESSSQTARSKMAQEYTQKHGPWFDGFEKETEDDDE